MYAHQAPVGSPVFDTYTHTLPVLLGSSLMNHRSAARSYMTIASQKPLLHGEELASD